MNKKFILIHPNLTDRGLLSATAIVIVAVTIFSPTFVSAFSIEDFIGGIMGGDIEIRMEIPDLSNLIEIPDVGKIRDDVVDEIINQIPDVNEITDQIISDVVDQIPNIDQTTGQITNEIIGQILNLDETIDNITGQMVDQLPDIDQIGIDKITGQVSSQIIGQIPDLNQLADDITDEIINQNPGLAPIKDQVRYQIEGRINDQISDQISNQIRGNIAVVFRSPIRATDFDEMLTGIFSWLWPISSAIAVLMIIIGAYLFVVSSGDPKKIILGKKIIIYALVGLAIVMMAKGIVELVKLILGV